MKYDRITKIRQLFLEKRTLSCSELCGTFGVSVETVRRDLAVLEKEGVIRRVYGGGVLQDNAVAPDPILPWAVRIIRNSPEKNSIARELVNRIEDGMTIILDSGTTMLETAKLLFLRHDLTVITNDIHIASELSSHTDHTVFFAGGPLKKEELITVGFMTTSFLDNFSRIDAALLTADGYRDGLWDFNKDMAALKAAMIRKADKVYAGLDHTKFSVEGLYRVCGQKDLDLLITGAQAPEEALASLREDGIPVELVPC